MRFGRFVALLVILFLVLFDLRAVNALDLPSFPFPTIRPFPTKTPKPTVAPNPTASPTTAPTAAPSTAPAKLEIEDVEPSSVNFMEEFTIYGSGFGASQGSVSFRVYNQSFVTAGAPIVFWSDTEIKAKVPALKKGSYRIQVITSDGKKSNEEKLTVKNGQPIIVSSSISAVNGKFELTFQGTEFGRRGSIDIYDGGTLVGNGVIRSWSTSRIRFELPALPTKEYGFQITAADGRKSSIRNFTLGN